MRQKDHAGPSRCSSAPPAAAGAPSRVSPTSPSSSPTWTPPPNGARTNSTSSANSSPPAHGYHPRSNQLNSYNLIGATIANTLLARMPVVSEILERGHSPGNDRLPDGYYHTLTQLRSELAGVGLTSIVVRGLTGPGSWLGVLINAHYGESELPATVAEPDPLQTALASARLADRSPELAVASSVLFAVAKKPT